VTKEAVISEHEEALMIKYDRLSDEVRRLESLAELAWSEARKEHWKNNKPEPLTVGVLKALETLMVDDLRPTATTKEMVGFVRPESVEPKGAS
jgi:hypothetical protein